jgi:hypothetical protein
MLVRLTFALKVGMVRTAAVDANDTPVTFVTESA